MGDPKACKVSQFSYVPSSGIGPQGSFKVQGNTLTLISSTSGKTKSVYNYPYYAINSTIAHSLLDAQQLKVVASSRPSGRNTILFTIGYEGISVEAYLNKLIRIKAL